MFRLTISFSKFKHISEGNVESIQCKFRIADGLNPGLVKISLKGFHISSLMDLLTDDKSIWKKRKIQFSQSMIPCQDIARRI